MKLWRSLSARILSVALLNLILLGATLIGLAGVQLQNMSTLLLAPTRDRLLADARLLALQLNETPVTERDRLLDERSRSRGVTFYLFDNKGRRIAGPGMLVPPVVHMRVVRTMLSESFSVTTRNPTRYWVGVPTPVTSPDGGEPIPGVFVMMSTSLFGNYYFVDLALVGSILLIVVLISGACWIPLIRRLTQSLSQMTLAAQKIADGDFDVQVSADRGDELGKLGAAVNQMGTRLNGFVRGQKRFLGDIAHELCSPIARIQAALGILELPDGDAAPEHIKLLQDEVEHMSALVSELLLFSKAGLQAAQTQSTPFLVADAVARAVSRESSPHALIEVSVDQTLWVLADPDSLIRALSNLIRNSIRYAGADGPVAISALQEGSDVFIRVADLGPGLPADALEQVFAPFHRLEPERGRDAGGVGLGLAIVKSCIETCKGTVRCINRVPRGLIVEIRLPAGTGNRELHQAPHSHILETV